METAYVLVLLGVFFLCCQLILCRMACFCRCSRHWLFIRAAEGANYLPNFLGSVALGAMPKEHSATLWMLYLIALNNSMVAYDPGDAVLYLPTICNIGGFIFRALNTAIHAGLGAAAYFCVAAMACASAACAIIVAQQRSASMLYSEEIAERHDRRQQGAADWDASSLKGYRYNVELEAERTLDEIFAQDDDRKRKDLCLSFALFQLLFCSYRGIPCYDKEAARHPKTRSLVLEGLLQQQANDDDDDGYARGFRVVQVELGFLYDHIHGGYVLSRSRATRYIYISLKFAMAAFMYVAGTVIYARSVHNNPYGFMAPLLLHGFFDLLQITFYCGSDRQMVSYTSNPNAWHHICLRRFMQLARYAKLDRWNLYWQDLLGQYSLLAVNPAAPAATGGCSLSSFLNWQTTTSLYSHSEEESAPETLPPCLKVSIARALKSLPEPGEYNILPPSLQTAQNFPGVEGVHKIENILKWHIATCYCEMYLENHGLQLDVGSERYQVAKLLSRYCAYLVAFRPELLPCTDTTTTRGTFKRVLDDVTSLVRDGNGLPLSLGNTLQNLDNRMIDNTVSPNKTAILSDGLRLGHHLINDIQEPEQLWANLAKIWVKLILWVAPQPSPDPTSAKNHAKYLAQGGEFVTHLWAMLSHAGILEQSSWPPCISGGQVTPWVYPINNSG